MSIDTTFSYIAKLKIEESCVIVSCDEDLITSLECTYEHYVATSQLYA